jgi:hypothetical protein
MFRMRTTPNKFEAEPAPSKAANAKPPDIASASVPDTLAALHVNPDTGLTHAEVDVRRKEHGYNEGAEEKGRPGHRTSSILGFGPDVPERPFQGGRTV